MATIKLFNVTFVNIGFLLNVTTLTIQITDISKPVMNSGTAQFVAERFFPFNSLSCDKNFLALCTNADSSIMPWKGQKTGQISSLLLESTPNLKRLVYQCNPRK